MLFRASMQTSFRRLAGTRGRLQRLSASSADPSVFLRLSSLQSSDPCTQTDLAELFQAMAAQKNNSAFENAVLWKVLGGTENFFAPHVAGSEGQLMLYKTPAQENSLTVGLFSAENKVIIPDGVEAKVQTINSQQVYEVMQQLTEKDKEKSFNVAFDGAFSIPWSEMAAQAWLESIMANFTRTVLQRAQSNEEIDEALQLLLGDMGAWFCLEHESDEKADEWSIPVVKLGDGPESVLAFCSPDLCLRTNPRPEAKTRFRRYPGKNLLDLALNGQAIALGHHVALDSKIGFVQLEQAGAERLVKLAEEKKKQEKD